MTGYWICAVAFDHITYFYFAFTLVFAPRFDCIWYVILLFLTYPFITVCVLLLLSNTSYILWMAVGIRFELIWHYSKYSFTRFDYGTFWAFDSEFVARYKPLLRAKYICTTDIAHVEHIQTQRIFSSNVVLSTSIDAKDRYEENSYEYKHYCNRLQHSKIGIDTESENQKWVIFLGLFILFVLPLYVRQGDFLPQRFKSNWIITVLGGTIDIMMPEFSFMADQTLVIFVFFLIFRIKLTYFIYSIIWRITILEYYTGLWVVWILFIGISWRHLIACFVNKGFLAHFLAHKESRGEQGRWSPCRWLCSRFWLFIFGTTSATNMLTLYPLFQGMGCTQVLQCLVYLKVSHFALVFLFKDIDCIINVFDQLCVFLVSIRIHSVLFYVNIFELINIILILFLFFSNIFINLKLSKGAFNWKIISPLLKFIF